jgi:hypothetical protein
VQGVQVSQRKWFWTGIQNMMRHLDPIHQKQEVTKEELNALGMVR